MSKWSVSLLTEISGIASPAGFYAKATSTKAPEQKRDEQQYRRGQLPQSQHISLMGLAVFCLLLYVASTSVLNGYVERDPSFGITLGVKSMDKVGK